MSLKHNKKRNVGLIREFFTQHIADSVANKNHKSVNDTKNIWKKYFSKGTELNKEIFLFNNLLETKLTNKESAIRFIEKIKSNTSKINQKKLNEEKTNLIREINNLLSTKTFFDKEVENYTTFATIQVCLDYWLNNNGKLKENIINPAIIELEDKILNHITKPVEIKVNKETIVEEIQSDKIVLKIMLEKFNKKFLDSLTESQKTIIKHFAFDNNKKFLIEEINKIKTNTLTLINKELNEVKKMPALQKEKFQTIKNLLEESKIDLSTNIDEDTVVFYMSISKLHDELIEE